jgi:hypothetical protein
VRASRGELAAEGYAKIGFDLGQDEVGRPGVGMEWLIAAAESEGVSGWETGQLSAIHVERCDPVWAGSDV